MWQSGINANIRPKQTPFLPSSIILLHRIIARHLFFQIQRPFNLVHCRLALLVATVFNTDVLLSQRILAVHLASISFMSSQELWCLTFCSSTSALWIMSCTSSAVSSLRPVGAFGWDWRLSGMMILFSVLSLDVFSSCSRSWCSILFPVNLVRKWYSERGEDSFI